MRCQKNAEKGKFWCNQRSRITKHAIPELSCTMRTFNSLDLKLWVEYTCLGYFRREGDFFSMAQNGINISKTPGALQPCPMLVGELDVTMKSRRNRGQFHLLDHRQAG